MPTEAERHFQIDMVSGAARLKQEIGYNPTRFTQMIGDLSAVEAVRRLLAGPVASEGLHHAVGTQALDMSVEAWVLLRWCRELFSDAERQSAVSRLEAHGFDVERTNELLHSIYRRG